MGVRLGVTALLALTFVLCAPPSRAARAEKQTSTRAYDQAVLLLCAARPATVGDLDAKLKGLGFVPDGTDCVFKDERARTAVTELYEIKRLLVTIYYAPDVARPLPSGFVDALMKRASRVDTESADSIVLHFPLSDSSCEGEDTMTFFLLDGVLLGKGRTIRWE